MAKRRKIERNFSHDTLPIGKAFDEFLAEKEAKNLSQSTLANYEQSVRLFMEFHNLPSTTSTDSISINYFHRWIYSLKEDGVKPTSINHYLRDCRAFFYWCMERDYLQRFKIELITGQEEAPKLFTDDELMLLLSKPRRDDSFSEWRTWTIVNWVLGTGCRASTIVDVKISDIDFTGKEISLAHTKNKKAQIIPLSPTLELALREYLRMWNINNDGWLFPNIGEEKLTTNALRHSFSRYCNYRGVKKTNIHGLRHNFAKGWVKNNGNMFALQKILGHSTLDMTKRYVRLFNEDLKEDFNLYSPLDTLKKSSKRTQFVKRA